MLLKLLHKTVVQLLSKNVDKSILYQKYGGEITVFLTLILLLLLSFVGAAIESARSSVLESFCERDLRLSMQSLFTEYTRPLWDDYHLFVLEGGNEVNQRFAETIEHYQGSISGGFYNESYRDTEILKTIGFLEESGKYYLEEITEYMKYHIPQDLLNKGKETVESAEKVQKTAEVLEQKTACEESLGELDKSLLKVIELIEGIEIYDGKIKVKGCFVKKIVPNEISPYSLGIMNEEVWKALKTKYINPKDVDVSLCYRVLDCIHKALNEIEKMERKKDSIQSEAEEYNRIYEANKNSMVEGIEANLNGEEAIWKSFHNNVISMKRDLEWNAQVLEDYIAEKQKKAKNAELILNEYRVSSLRFDYQNLKINGQKSPLKSLEKTMSGSLLSLVAENPKDISEKAMPKPFLIAEKQKGSLLEISYYQKHFKNYSDKEEQKTYDLEYIATGKDTEKEALQGVLKQLLIQRGLFNYMYILTDKERTEQAYLAAVGLVGFSGMEPLIQAAKAGILLCWAMAEAHIDIAVLLRGSSVSLWKTKESFHLNFQELFTFGRELIQRKAGEEVSSKGKEGLDYKDYLGMLLFFVKPSDRINRSLALIDHNMKNKYSSSFTLMNGVFGLSASSEYGYDNRRIKVNLMYTY